MHHVNLVHVGQASCSIKQQFQAYVLHGTAQHSTRTSQFSQYDHAFWTGVAELSQCRCVNCVYVYLRLTAKEDMVCSLPDAHGAHRMRIEGFN